MIEFFIVTCGSSSTRLIDDYLYFVMELEWKSLKIYKTIFQRTINVNINQEPRFVEPKVRKREQTFNAAEYYPSGDINDQQNLENLAAIAFLESEMSEAAKLLTMPFINK